MSFSSIANKDPVQLQKEADGYRVAIEQLEAERERLNAQLEGYSMPEWDQMIENVMKPERLRLMLKFRTVDPSDERVLLILHGQINEIELLSQLKAAVLVNLNTTDGQLSDYRGKLSKVQSKLERVLE